MSRKKAERPEGSRQSSHEVAARAGVSQSAVSRALSDLPGVSAATRVRIKAIAEEMDYRPNALARSLSTQRSGLVGVIVSSLANPFFNDVLERILRLSRRKGLQVMLFAADSDEEVGEVAIDLRRYQIEMSFVISPHLPEVTARKFALLGPSVILFNRLVPGMDQASSVYVDNRAAGALVAQHLLDRGHRLFGYVHGLAGAVADRDRFEGFCERLMRHAIAPPVEGVGGFCYDGGVQAARTMLARSPRPTAVFCANDAMAMGVLDVARQDFGLAIPGDLAVVGFDDATAAAWLSYQLTTVRQPVETVISAAMELLPVASDHVPRSIVIMPELIVRRTT